MSSPEERIITEKLSNAILKLDFKEMQEILQSDLVLKTGYLTKVSFFNPQASALLHEGNKDFFEKNKKKKFSCAEGCKIFGETHQELGAKISLIENMNSLKKEGFEIFYLEHLFFDKMQLLLDQYFNSPEGIPMPEALEKFLDELSEGHMGAFEDLEEVEEELEELEEVEDSKESKESKEVEETEELERGEKENLRNLYNYKALIEAAKKNKIRIIALDSSFSYAMNEENPLDESNERQYAMNHQAIGIINQTSQGKKWFALVGNSHVKQYLGVPGLADMFDKAESIYISDNLNKLEGQLEEPDSRIVIPTDLYRQAYSDPRKIIKMLEEKPSLYERLDLGILVKVMIKSSLESSEKNKILKSLLDTLSGKDFPLNKEKAERAILILKGHFSKESRELLSEPLDPGSQKPSIIFSSLKPAASSALESMDPPKKPSSPAEKPPR